MRRLSVAIAKRAMPTVRNGSRGLSTAGANFSERERGEEARYFRQEEEAKKKAIRAQLEKTLAEPHAEENKEQLLELLSKYMF